MNDLIALVIAFGIGLLIAAVFDYRASCERQRAWDDLLVRLRRGDFDKADQ